jgi:hypothetical protein
MFTTKAAPDSASTAGSPVRRRRGTPPVSHDPEPAGAPGPARDLAPTATAGTTDFERDAEAPVSRVTVELYQGDISELYADVAVVGRYRGVGARGPARLFDKRFGGWLTSAVELGMVGSELGELFYVPVTRPVLTGAAARRVTAAPQTFAWDGAPASLIVGGLGEPGRFNREGLRYLLTNVTLAVLTLGYGKMSAPLLGFSRGEIPLEGVLRGTLEGVSDALGRLPAKLRGGLVLRLIHDHKDVVDRMWAGLLNIGEQGIGGLILAIEDRRRPVVGGEASPRVRAADAAMRRFADSCGESERTTRITITCASDSPAAPPGTAARNWHRFQYAALAEAAVIPVREQLVQEYFVSQLPQRLTTAPPAAQETYGKLLSGYLVPEDFRKLIEAGDPLTLVLDSSTALYPWEMAGFKGYHGTTYYGIQLRMARQFRTLHSAAPGIAPALNHSLRVLLIADPAPDLPCPGAVGEARAVLDTFWEVRQSWQAEKLPFTLDVTARIGPPPASGRSVALEEFRRHPLFRDAAADRLATCDAVELLALLLGSEPFDIVHYAGHGVFDPESQRMGWVFGKENCILSAAEIFCIRQVPRLVFANACWSSAVLAGPPDAPAATEERERRLQVGLAEAFFARGIQNYLGAGWPVSDTAAAVFAQQFYRTALGLAPASGSNGSLASRRTGRPRPATLGAAVAAGRQALFPDPRHPERAAWGTAWGAYQHYGQSGARLLGPPDEDESEGDAKA